MFRKRLSVLYALLSFLILTGCSSGDNGVPADLIALLKDRGVAIQPSRVLGPLSKRHGYIVAPYDERQASDIVSIFRLERVMASDPQWLKIRHQVSGLGLAEQLWGIRGRPSQLKLKDGAQFEHLFLLATPEREMFVVAEYAPE